MPSREHEVLIQMFRNRPSLAAVLLGQTLGVGLPPYTEARIESGDLTDCLPTEYRADAVVVLAGPDQQTAVVVEVQRGRDEGKQWSWPVYLITLRARLRCPTLLLVICPDDGTAAWCAKPIETGHPGWVLRPLVVGPGSLPVITDPCDAARSPELTVLAAIAHGQDTRVLDALLDTLNVIDAEQARLYADYVLQGLPEVARKYLEDVMAVGTYEYQSAFAKKYVAETKATAVLAVLAARGLSVPDEVRERVTSCTDTKQLDAWIRRAATIATSDELLA